MICLGVGVDDYIGLYSFVGEFSVKPTKPNKWHLLHIQDNDLQ